MMKPILFNTEMVKAILDGRKAVTRRVIKPQPVFPVKNDGQTFTLKKGDLLIKDGEVQKFELFIDNLWLTSEVNPPCKVGDILYVRETWQTWYDEIVDVMKYCFYEDMIRRNVVFTEEEDEPIKWKPSIHMPKEAARIFLKVTDVRVERLQDITEEQVKMEGVGDPYDYQSDEWYERNGLGGNYFKDAFYGLWDSLLPPNKNRFKCPENEWKTNPWVWVIEFKRIEKPTEMD